MIRLGVIGYGNRISGVIDSCLREVEPDIRVVGIVDPDENGVRSRLAECDQKDVVFYKDLKSMIRKANLDALAIGTRCNLHAPYAIEAAEYDLPLYLEKPVAISMEQAMALERAFEKSKCEVVVSFPLRVSPLCSLAHEYIDKKTIGSPEHIQAVNYVNYGTVYFDTAAYRDFKTVQGLFLQKATHDFDYMSYLMGSNIVRVAAMHTRGRVFGGKKKKGLVCSKCKETDTCLESPQNRKRNSSGGTLNVSGNVVLPFDDKGYTIQRCDFNDFATNYISKFPNRFLAYTMSDFAQWDDFTIFNKANFVDMTIQHLEEDIKKGAHGLKVTKELGLQFKDTDGSMIAVNDKRLYPVWKRAGELKIPVLIHTSDPAAFFLPIDKYNEHYLPLQEFPGWSFQGSHFSKQELLEQRDQMIADHPGTTFICPHTANYPEDLDYVARFLDNNSNVYIDFSARIDELGRQPYRARDFMIKYQDRILFGTDMPISVDVYRCYFRFLETADEYFDYPDYMGRWGYSRWKIYGLNLPDEVLRKIYYENALKIIPGIKGF